MIASVWVMVKFVIGCVAFYGQGGEKRYQIKGDKGMNNCYIYQTIDLPTNNLGNSLFLCPRQKFCEDSLPKCIAIRGYIYRCEKMLGPIFKDGS